MSTVPDHKLRQQRNEQTLSDPLGRYPLRECSWLLFMFARLTHLQLKSSSVQKWNALMGSFKDILDPFDGEPYEEVKIAILDTGLDSEADEDPEMIFYKERRRLTAAGPEIVH